MISAHAVGWPVARGGSQRLTDGLAAYLRSLGGEVVTGSRVASLSQLPSSRAVLCDVSPRGLIRIAGDRMPARYRRALERYRRGPGVFKVDWALDAPIPWADQRCLQASTVHLGGTLDEIAASERAAWEGRHHEQPFVLVCQQSQLDPSRAPPGKHTGYAYCHVPAGSPRDVSDLIEAQLERFAHGFRDRILARHVTGTAELERYNANYIGGAITGGAANFGQLFFRPVARLDPYRTPNRRLYLCSASTPPGGGVHGMCGDVAAR
jgi:phytoene dehydrogenase-like protein